MKTFAMNILGCKVNDFEATYVRENMLKYFKEVSNKEKADIYIIFTCCVTNVAEAKTRKCIHQARRNNPDAYIVTIGCLSQIKGSEETFNDVDLIIGSSKKDQIVDLILANTKGNYVDKIIPNKFEELCINSYPGKSRAFLKIQDGCNQYCSYCIIPYSRGPMRSGNHETIINNAKRLVKDSKEIVLTGIHTGRYFDGEYNLYMLLKDLCTIQGLETIRLSSIEITEISDEIIDLIKNNDKIAHHLHIPVQACSNEILKLMNRPYTIEEFINRVDYIRNQIPDICISTDLICGFPNETDEIFKQSLINLNKLNFAFIHCFPYARKQGTVADTLKGHIDEKIKKERVQTILDISKQSRKQYNNHFINKPVDVLIEQIDDIYSYGYTKNYIYTKIEGIFPIGKIVKCEIIKADDEVIARVIKPNI